MKKQICPHCGNIFSPQHGNQTYCTNDCYLYSKNIRAKEYYEHTMNELLNSKILANELICQSLLLGDTEMIFTDFDHLDKLGFQFRYFSEITEDHFGYAFVMQKAKLRMINPSIIQIQKS